MGLIDDIKELFEAKTLYEVLGITKDANSDAIKKAYRKKSLQCHPDKADDDQRAVFTEKFQVLSKCYDILQDEERRKIYDETGSVDDDSDRFADRDWEQYWRNLFPKIDTKQIDDFLDKYRGSEDEKKDLQEIYERCKGDLNKIMAYHMGYSLKDEDRISDLLKEMIGAGDIQDYPAFSKESAASKRKRRKMLEREADEVEEFEREEAAKGDGMAALALAIQGRQRQREEETNDFLAALEAKYAQPKSKKPKTTPGTNGKAKKSTKAKGAKKK